MQCWTGELVFHLDLHSVVDVTRDVLTRNEIITEKSQIYLLFLRRSPPPDENCSAQISRSRTNKAQTSISLPKMYFYHAWSERRRIHYASCSLDALLQKKARQKQRLHNQIHVMQFKQELRIQRMRISKNNDEEEFPAVVENIPLSARVCFWPRLAMEICFIY